MASSINSTLNRSRIRTIMAVVLTSNLRLAEARGNVLIPASEAGLPKDCVANVSQVITVDRAFLTDRCGKVPSSLMRTVDEGLRLALSL
jgi:mRNA interferase MazF